ncbi:phage holin family protein [Nocardia callitridis]|uniref:Phage holin family protein n=1 Tax=Nocardia callitridis TaxID=648753 RepID=A0ABP9KVY2_9NOCA
MTATQYGATQSGHRTDNRSVSELVSDTTNQTSRLIRDEIQLARLDLQRKAKAIGLGAGLTGVGGLFAFFGLAVLVVAAVLGLAVVLPNWAAALIVAAALLLVGGLLALFGGSKIRKSLPPVPREAVEGVKTDIASVKGGRNP